MINEMLFGFLNFCVGIGIGWCIARINRSDVEYKLMIENTLLKLKLYDYKLLEDEEEDE